MIINTIKTTNDTFLRSINIDADILIPDSFINYTETILSMNREYSFMSPTEKLSRDQYCWNPSQLPLDLGLTSDAFYGLFDDMNTLSEIMLGILLNIPIYLKKGGSLDNLNEDVLGLYFSSYQDEPAKLYLFSDRIWDAAGHNSSLFKLFTAIVLIHELAHASMDPSNYNHTDYNSIKYKSYKRVWCNRDRYYLPDVNGDIRAEEMNFYHVREESYANAITLRIFALSHLLGSITDHDSEIKQFIKNQPAEYRLSLDIAPFAGIGGWIEAKETTHNSYTIMQQDAYLWMDITEKALDGLITQSQLKNEELRWHWACQPVFPSVCDFMTFDFEQLVKCLKKDRSVIINQYGDKLINDDDKPSMFSSSFLSTEREQQGIGIKTRILNKRFQILDPLISKVYYNPNEDSEYIVVIRNNKWMIVNKNWEVIQRPTRALVITQVINYPRTDVYIAIQDQNKWILYDFNMKVVLTLPYDNVEGITKVLFVKLPRKRNNCYLFKATRTFSCIKVQLNSLWGILSSSGSVMVPCDYDEILPDSTYAILYVKKNNKWGVIDYYNNTVLSIQYDSLEDCKQPAVYRSLPFPGFPSYEYTRLLQYI